jgi:hypothetical protein
VRAGGGGSRPLGQPESAPLATPPGGAAGSGGGQRPRDRDIATALVASLVLGLAADRLLWAGPLGPGFALWLALLAAAAIYLARGRSQPRVRAVAAWSVVAVLAAAGTAWRASEALALLLLAVAGVAASAVLLEARGIRLGRTRVLDHIYGLVLVPALGAVGAFPLLGRVTLPDTGGRRRFVAVGRGVLLAAPPLVVFGALFASADPAFERVVGRLIPDLELLPAHVFLVGFFGWVAAGLLGGVFPARGENPLALLRLPRVGVEETATVLGLVAALFVTFIAVQFSYLFGGPAAIEGISGLTLAEYARRGFFELVVVAGLVLALLLAGSAAAPRGAGRRVYRVLGTVLVGLVMLVIVSAVLRLRLYIAEFGLTAARFYAAAIMAWLAVCLGLLAATVLRDLDRPFASGAMLTGIVTVAVLAVLNPDARVAATNLARAAGPGADRPVDATYLTRLSADATPVLVDGLDALDPVTRCELADRLLTRWGPEASRDTHGDWRVWNAGSARARGAVAAALPELRAAAVACAGPG